MLSSARHALERVDSCKRVRRALLARSRATPPSTELKLGDAVFCFRDGRRKNGRKRSWHGPAVVIGTEPSAIYVSYEGKSTKCAPEAVRRASPDEALGMSVKEQLEVMEQALLDEPEQEQGGRAHQTEEEEASNNYQMNNNINQERNHDKRLRPMWRCTTKGHTRQKP